MILTSYSNKHGETYQMATFDDDVVPKCKRGYHATNTQTQPSNMDTVVGRSRCTRQLRTQTRKQRETVILVGQRR